MTTPDAYGWYFTRLKRCGWVHEGPPLTIIAKPLHPTWKQRAWTLRYRVSDMPGRVYHFFWKWLP